LLSKLNSLSSSIKIDGLDGLMELVKNEDSRILEDHLSILLNKIAPLATDREKKIRKLANSIFSTIIKQVSCNTLTFEIHTFFIKSELQ